MTRPTAIDLHIDRLVLEGISLDAIQIEAMRASVIATLTDWLSDLNHDALHSEAISRVAAPPLAIGAVPDGRELGVGIAGAIRAVVSPAGGDAS